MATKEIPTPRGGRIVKGDFQSAVQEYRHPSGRSIRLVGLVHLAEPDYFAEIRRITEEAEESGATVLYEGVRAGTEFREVSDDERSAMIAHDQVLDIQNEDVLKLFNLPWIHQGKSVLAPCFKKWETADANTLDMIRLLGTKNATIVAPSAAKFGHYKRLKETKGEDSPAFMFARGRWVQAFSARCREPGRATRVVHHVVRGMRILSGGIARTVMRRPAPTGGGWENSYIYTYRECVAALRTLGTKGDVVLLWHPGHMIHLGQIFMRNGFEPSETVEWLTAFHKVKLDPTRQTAAPEADT